jgi:hypothetical protein
LASCKKLAVAEFCTLACPRQSRGKAISGGQVNLFNKKKKASKEKILDTFVFFVNLGIILAYS